MASRSTLSRSPFPETRLPDSRLPLLWFPKPMARCAVELAALRNRAQQAAMRFAGPPRVDATQYTRLFVGRQSRGRLRPRNGARAATLGESFYKTRQGVTRAARPRRPSQRHGSGSEARACWREVVPVRGCPPDEAPSATRGEGGSGRFWAPSPSTSRAQWENWLRETGFGRGLIGNPASGGVDSGRVDSGTPRFGRGLIGNH